MGLGEKKKQKKCKNCGGYFPPFNSLQKVCGTSCAVALVGKEKKKERKRETREMREKLKTRSDFMREAQTACNRYIRARDAGNPCISCGGNTGAKMNAGHYRSVGSCPELRFNEFQIYFQCEKCNSYLSGNQIEYRKALRLKIGDELLEWIESNHGPKKYTVEELKEIKQLYNYFANQLEKSLR